MTLADLAKQHGTTVHRSILTSGHHAWFGPAKVVELAMGGYLLFVTEDTEVRDALWFDTVDQVADHFQARVGR